MNCEEKVFVLFNTTYQLMIAIGPRETEYANYEADAVSRRKGKIQVYV